MAVACLGGALFDTTKALRNAVRELSQPMFHWMELFNSLVATWPDLATAAIDDLASPSQSNWQSWFQFITVLAFPAGEHPLWHDSILPWERFGQEFGVCWTQLQASALAAAIDDAHVQTGLAKSAMWADRERAVVQPTHEDILTFVLETDLRRRRANLLDQLQSTAPAQFWPDEHGRTIP